MSTAAVLPIENSLHGSVAEHYDLLLETASPISPAKIRCEFRHNVIAAPGVTLSQIRRVMSHPVALSQCRRFLSFSIRSLRSCPFMTLREV